MRKAKVLFKNEEASILTKHYDSSFSFVYHDEWVANSSKQSISLTSPKNLSPYPQNVIIINPPPPKVTLTSPDCR
jgi:HipA-like protein